MNRLTEVIRNLNIQINCKLLFTRSISITCYFLAGYYSLLQVLDYMKNEDVSLLTYRKYNDEPTDKYPTFSICLSTIGSDALLEYDNVLYREETIQQNLNMTGADYYNMLIGGSFRGDELTNFSLLQFEDAKWELMKMISIYVADNNEETLEYWDEDLSNTSLPNSLFYPGYQSPDRLCFTRNKSYIPSKPIVRETVYLDVEGWVGNLLFYLHYPGQLINVIEQGETTSFEEVQRSDFNKKILKVGITQTQVLKKRHDSRIPCNRDYESNVDMRWRESVMSMVGCIPTYWKSLPQSLSFRSHSFNECTLAQQYSSFYDYTLYTADSNITYETSCTWAQIFSKLLFENRNDGLSGFIFELKHESQYYEEVKNLKATRFYDLWSQIGGLVGIFLGCSLIQIPRFAWKLLSIFKSPINN